LKIAIAKIIEDSLNIKVIPDDEPSILDDAGLPRSFYHALATFFIGGAIRLYRGDDGKHAMLVHPSQRKFDHKIVSVTEIINERQ
jgi:hypothetical protein